MAKTFHRTVFKVDGKQKQRRGFTTKAEARKEEREALSLGDKQTALTNPKLTLGEYLHRWFEGIETVLDIGVGQLQRISIHLNNIYHILEI